MSNKHKGDNVMGYIDIIIENKNKIDSIYDMVSLCYDLIIKELSDEELFIGEYIVKNDKANENNPNIEKLIYFQEMICKTLKQSKGDVESCFDSIIELAVKIYNELNTYGIDKMNKLTPLYFIILAIDRYSENINNSQYSNTPLNHYYVEESLIYFKPCRSLIYDAAKELKFSRYITVNNISSCLNNITIIKKNIFSDNKSPTKIFSLYLDETGFPQGIIEKKLNVAIIPFNGFEITNISKDRGALFSIKYNSDYGSIYSKRAIFLLDKAIEQKANIVVFPEYICNEEVQSNIGKHLVYIKDTNPEKLKELLFVVAGTGWINGNNISKVYDKDGVLIGSHYKITKYHDDQLIENLETPGKESLAIDVKGVGRFMLAICRDISYGNNMYPLFDAFKPFSILIPAWSTSVNIGFNTQCCNLAAKYHMSSILCNSCEPIKSKKFKKKNNLIVTPYKDIAEGNTYITGKVKMVEREVKCDCECEKKACIFLITMDYSVDSVKNGEIVTNCRQFITEIG